ncbi:MAG: hypothetical protein ACI9DC_005480 [Gammaproteobacteria bacterium]|jgi:hypothetical protein
MATDPKQVVTLTMHAQKALRMSVRAKPAHLRFLFSGGFMRNLYSIVRVLIVAVRDGRHHITLCGGVTAKFVRGDLDRHFGLGAQ